MLRNRIVYLLFFVAIMGSCKKEFEGDKTTNTTPETYLAVDSIYRSGENRYTTTVEAHWWGTVQGSFIKGYEVSIDNMQTWEFTTKQQSTFLLTLPFGSDTGDIRIFVRAINNEGIKDPTPASVAYPVKNTPPTIAFDYSQGRKTSSYPAFRFNWKAVDADGDRDILQIEVCFNDTTKIVTLPPTINASSFVGERINGNFTGNYLLYNNTQTTAFSQKLTGIVLNSVNYLYIRSVDRTGSKSPWAKDSLFIKQPQASGIVFINDYNSNRNQITNFYTARLNNLGAGYNQFDTIKSLLDELPSDAFTMAKAFDFFNRVVWVTEDPTRSLGAAQSNTGSFFNNGGKLFMVLEIPADVPEDAAIFNFTPIRSLVANPGRAFRMSNGDRIIGYTNWPELKATSIITLPRPFNPYSGSTGLFTYDSLARAELRSFGPGGAPAWTGPSTVMAKRINTQRGKADLVTLTVPMHLMNGNNNVDSFFKQVVISELGF